MNTIVPLVFFVAAGAYFIGNQRGGRPWIYVAVSVPISIAIYVCTVMTMAYLAKP
jgi:hypothetical protein